MKPFKIPITAMLLVMVFSLNVSAQQDPFYPLLMAELKTTGGDTLSDGYVNISDSTLLDTHIVISLYDTVNISKIHVVLRKTATSPDLLAQSFNFNSVQVNGFDVDLGLGSYKCILHCYGEAWIEKTDGTLSAVFKIIR